MTFAIIFIVHKLIDEKVAYGFVIIEILIEQLKPTIVKHTFRLNKCRILFNLAKRLMAQYILL